MSTRSRGSWLRRLVRVAGMVWLGGACLASCQSTPTSPAPTPTASAAPPPTFGGEVHKILRAHCVECHRERGGGPFELGTYAQAKAHATQIAEVTASGFMPPWLPEPGYEHFVGERRLTPAQKSILARWAKAGAPAGELGQVPAPPQAPPTWRLGQPDQVLEAEQAFELPADGTDVYRNFVLRVPTGAMRFVQATELRPGDPFVVHHAVMRIDSTGKARRKADADPTPGFDGMVFAGAQMPDGRFVGWTPGKVPASPDPDTAWVLRGGVDLVLQVHMRPTGKVERIRPKIGLHFSPTPPTRKALAMELSSTAIDIPAGVSDYRVTDSYTLPADVRLLSIYPHAHYIAKRMRGTALLPNGSKQTLIRIDDWDFNWQDQYRFERPVALPKGTRITMDYVYDNSSANPRNPFSPPRRIVNGPNSTDEMAELILELEPTKASDLAVLDADFMRKWLQGQVATAQRTLADPTADQAATLATLAAVQGRLGQHVLAKKNFERSLELRPKHAETLTHFAVSLVALGDNAQARQQLDQATAIDTTYAAAWTSLANLQRRAGELKAAQASYTRAIEADPNAANAHNNLGVTLEALARPGNAAQSFARAAQLSPTKALFRVNLARALNGAGRPGSAIKAYREALQINPRALKAMRGLSWILATTSDENLRNGQEALAVASAAAKLTSNRSPEILESLGAAFAEVGQFENAKRATQAAIELANTAKRPDLAKRFAERLGVYASNQAVRE